MKSCSKSIRKLPLWFALCVVTASCVHHRTDPQLNEQQLAQRLGLIEAWPGHSTVYSKNNWDQLISLAKIVQRCDPESVQNVFSSYQKSYADDLMVEPFNDSKLYLLMRVTFELPERVDFPDARVQGGGWVSNATEYNKDGTVNLAWPISWNNGNPKLISGFIGIQGMSNRYDAAAEYRGLYEAFPRRNLDEN